MQILILTQFFDPEPTFKGLVFARSLKEQGHEVSVLTGFPNYPGGKIYSGYKIRAFQKEQIDGVAIYRVPLFPSHGKSKIGRVLNYGSFFLTAFCALLFLSFRKNIVYVYHPPATVGVAAALSSLITRVPFVYDIQDLWPDTLSATGMISNIKILKMVGVLCKWIYSRAVKIVVLSPGFKKLLIERGVPENKIEIIYNWCDEKSLQAESRSSNDYGMANRFNVVFAGNIGKAQALHVVLAAAQILAVKNPQILISFVGSGIELESLKEKAKMQNIKNVQFIPHMPMNEVGAVLKASDVLLVHLKNDPLFAVTVPSKTQAYLAIGKPVLMAVHGDAADLINEARAGLTIPSENPSAMADAILQFAAMETSRLDAMGQCGLNFYFTKLSLKIGTLKFIEVFRKASYEKA